MANARLFGFWNNLTEALRTGELQNEAKGGGVPLFEELYADPARLKQFAAAMTGISHGASVAIAQQFPWADYKTFAISAPRKATWPSRSPSPNPHLSGCGFDLARAGPDLRGVRRASTG